MNKTKEQYDAELLEIADNIENCTDAYPQARFIDAATNLLKKLMTFMVISKYKNTVFSANEIGATYLEKCYGCLRVTVNTQGYGRQSRTVITVAAKFLGTTELTKESCLAFEAIITNFFIATHIEFDPLKRDGTRSGLVVLQTVIDHATLEESEIFKQIDEAYHEVMGDTYPRFANDQEGRVCAMLNFIVAQMLTL